MQKHPAVTLHREEGNQQLRCLQRIQHLKQQLEAQLDLGVLLGTAQHANPVKVITTGCTFARLMEGTARQEAVSHKIEWCGEYRMFARSFLMMCLRDDMEFALSKNPFSSLMLSPVCTHKTQEIHQVQLVSHTL